MGEGEKPSVGCLGIAFVHQRRWEALPFIDRDCNLAMFGKEALCLIQKLDSLVAKLYKARYLPKVSFLEA